MSQHRLSVAHPVPLPTVAAVFRSPHGYVIVKTSDSRIRLIPVWVRLVANHRLLKHERRRVAVDALKGLGVPHRMRVVVTTVKDDVPRVTDLVAVVFIMPRPVQVAYKMNYEFDDLVAGGSEFGGRRRG